MNIYIYTIIYISLSLSLTLSLYNQSKVKCVGALARVGTGRVLLARVEREAVWRGVACLIVEALPDPGLMKPADGGGRCKPQLRNNLRETAI